MDGRVLTFDVNSGAGIIRASDGKRYKFGGTDFSSPGVAQQGDEVDFEISADRAAEIFVTKKAPISGAIAATALTGMAEMFKQQINEGQASAAQGEYEAWFGEGKDRRAHNDKLIDMRVWNHAPAPTSDGEDGA